ncbi:MAG TPA: hypothetical protein VHP14_18365 [Anaerolineales bacterium]|nr:hypothetical protein [Anaerolineales bacterium]
MMTAPEAENSPPTTQEILDRVAPIQSVSSRMHSDTKASAVSGPLPVAPGKLSMTEEEKTQIQIDAMKSVRHK